MSDLQDRDQVVKEVREGSERLTVKSVSVITIEEDGEKEGEEGRGGVKISRDVSD